MPHYRNTHSSAHISAVTRFYPRVSYLVGSTRYFRLPSHVSRGHSSEMLRAVRLVLGTTNLTSRNIPQQWRPHIGTKPLNCLGPDNLSPPPPHAHKIKSARARSPETRPTSAYRSNRKCSLQEHRNMTNKMRQSITLFRSGRGGGGWRGTNHWELCVVRYLHPRRAFGSRTTKTHTAHFVAVAMLVSSASVLLRNVQFQLRQSRVHNNYLLSILHDSLAYTRSPNTFSDTTYKKTNIHAIFLPKHSYMI